MSNVLQALMSRSSQTATNFTINYKRNMLFTHQKTSESADQQSICRLVSTSAATSKYPTTIMAPQQDQKPPRKRHKMADVSPADTLRTENDTPQESDREKVHEQTDKDLILVVSLAHHRYCTPHSIINHVFVLICTLPENPS